jgi:ribosomal protein S18 acetylase RimI-like enzyme
MYTIRLLTAEDAGALWALRLVALTEHPDSFGESAAEHQRTAVEVLEKRLAGGGVESFVVGVFDEAGLAGMTGFYRDTREKRRHKGHIWGMYVAPRLRGRGAGEALLREAIRVAKTGDGLRTILLSVSETQPGARRLYERLGFVQYGVEPVALRVGEQDLEEQFLVLRLY